MIIARRSNRGQDEELSGQQRGNQLRPCGRTSVPRYVVIVSRLPDAVLDNGELSAAIRGGPIRREASVTPSNDLVGVVASCLHHLQRQALGLGHLDDLFSLSGRLTTQ